tara:strand:- start:6 stop:386 length:381 start_codon:yes stop_codon:yes gene_type:complete
MALLVLFSTLSFTVESHFCGDILVDTSLFGKVETCGMDLQKTSTSTDCDITKKNCCSDEQLLVQGQDTLKTSFDKLDKEQQIFVVALVQSYIYLFESNEANITSFKDYSPPPLIRDVQVLDQTFLI